VSDEFNSFQDFLSAWFKETVSYEDQSKTRQWFGHADANWNDVIKHGEYKETGKKLLDNKTNELTKMKLRSGFHGMVSYEQAMQHYLHDSGVLVGKHGVRACTLNEQVAKQIKKEYEV